MDLFQSEDATPDLLVEDLKARAEELHDTDLSLLLLVIERNEVSHIVKCNSGSEAVANRGELSPAEVSRLIQV